MTGNGEALEVHLAELRRFARELRGEVDGLEARREDLAALGELSSGPALLGNFAEAARLAAVHTAALEQVSDLYVQVQEMIGFTESVAREVADRYEHRDAVSGQGYDALGADSTVASAGMGGVA